MLSGDRKGRPKQDLPTPLRTASGATRVRLPRATPVLAELGAAPKEPLFYPETSRCYFKTIASNLIYCYHLA